MPVHILDIHDKVDRGEVFFISKTFLEVPNNGSIYLRHVTGDTQHLHSILNIETSSQWLFTSFIGTTYTDNGTILNPINRRSDSTRSLKSVFYHTPTIDVLGSERLDFMFGVGANPSNVSTSQLSDNLESIFAPNSDVLIRLTNLSGSIKYISTIFNVYED